MKKKKLSGETIFQIVDVIVMCLFMVLVIVPVFTVVMTSFVSEAEIARRGTFIIIPEKFDFPLTKCSSPVEKISRELMETPCSAW